jgi:hypothetical protein
MHVEPEAHPFASRQPATQKVPSQIRPAPPHWVSFVHAVCGPSSVFGFGVVEARFSVGSFGFWLPPLASLPGGGVGSRFVMSSPLVWAPSPTEGAEQAIDTSVTEGRRRATRRETKREEARTITARWFSRLCAIPSEVAW